MLSLFFDLLSLNVLSFFDSPIVALDSRSFMILSKIILQFIFMYCFLSILVVGHSWNMLRRFFDMWIKFIMLNTIHTYVVIGLPLVFSRVLDHVDDVRR